MKTPDFMSYDRYKKKKKNVSQSSVLLGVTTFFVTLLLFTAIAKALSPDVDVTIGDDAQTDAKDTGLGVKKFIDDRLKLIQMEDNSAGVSIKETKRNSSEYGEDSFEGSVVQEEEKIVLPSKSKKNDEESVYEEPIRLSNSAPPRPAGKQLSSPFESPKVSKVYVGKYSTMEQARVAQDILIDSGLDITPFVKDLGGSYTLQVGSYTSRAKAQSLANELLQNNLPARVVTE